jgi:hypothetical protein
MNNTVRKHPRSMQEAFGPYTSDNLAEMASERSWRLADVAITCLLIAVVIGIITGVL